MDGSKDRTQKVTVSAIDIEIWSFCSALPLGGTFNAYFGWVHNGFSRSYINIMIIMEEFEDQSMSKYGVFWSVLWEGQKNYFSFI